MKIYLSSGVKNCPVRLHRSFKVSTLSLQRHLRDPSPTCVIYVESKCHTSATLHKNTDHLAPKLQLNHDRVSTPAWKHRCVPFTPVVPSHQTKNMKRGFIARNETGHRANSRLLSSDLYCNVAQS